VRFGSPRFGQWCGAHLSADNHHQLWVPPGFAHGFLVLSDYATFAYKCTAPYHPEAELVLRWDDPTIGVAWPEPPSELSVRDASGLLLDDVPRHRLPVYDRDA
jgi:dTDP-4-dehydrorhamnose 3,5-epimerase